MAPKRQSVPMPGRIRRHRGLIMREGTAGQRYSIKAASRRQHPDFPKLFSTSSMRDCSGSAVKSDLGIPGQDRMKQVQLWLQYDGPIEDGRTSSSSDEDEGSLKEV